MEKLFLFVAVLVTVAWAQPVIELKPYNVTAAGMFVAEDKDGDGNLTRAESVNTFVKYDFNGDGRIERMEYACYQFNLHPGLGSFSHALFDDYDVDNDHHLDEHDLNAFYDLMDANGDEGVTMSEFEDFWIKLFVKYENYHVHGHLHPLHNAKACEHIHGGVIG